MLSSGGAPIPDGLADGLADDLGESVLAVSYAPQLELLPRATLAITHGGLSTVLQCLSNAVPMVAIPVSADPSPAPQPSTAARLQWSGAAEFVPIARLNRARLRAAVLTVLGNPRYREHATRLRTAITNAGGVARAADIVELVLATGEPVLAR